jgi:hypothetical protein
MSNWKLSNPPLFQSICQSFPGHEMVVFALPPWFMMARRDVADIEKDDLGYQRWDGVTKRKDLENVGFRFYTTGQEAVLETGLSTSSPVKASGLHSHQDA